MQSARSEKWKGSKDKRQIKHHYDQLSGFYDLFTKIFEKESLESALEHLTIQKGEIVLEIGFGTGHCLKKIAELVGKTGKVFGIDISFGMIEVSKKRLKKAKLLDRVALSCGDGSMLPYKKNQFHKVFMGFTLELFDTFEIPKVLEEIKRVLKNYGRLGIIGMSKENRYSVVQKMYEWLNQKFPHCVDCKPIYVEQWLKNAHFRIIEKEKMNLFGLSLEIVIGEKEPSR